MKRFAVTVHVTQEVIVLVDAETKEDAGTEAEKVGLGFRNAIRAEAKSAAPTTQRRNR